MNPLKPSRLATVIFLVCFLSTDPRQTSAKPKPRNYGSPVSSMLGSLFKLMNLMRTVVFPLRHETMLTEAGLPLWLRLDLVGAMRIDTDFRLEKNPGQLQRNMNMVLDIKPRFVLDEIRPDVIKLFLCSTQLSTIFILINTTSERLKVRIFFICWYFRFYEQLKFHAQLLAF